MTSLRATLLTLTLLALRASAEDLTTATTTIKNDLTSNIVIGGGMEGGAGNVQGNAFLLLPLWSTLDRAHGGSLLFLEPEVVWREEDQWFGALGLGFRHWFEAPLPPDQEGHPLAVFLGDGWFVGGNVFLDAMRSLQGQSFYQVSGGIEIGSRFVTIRANHYWPLTDAQRFAEVRTVSVRNTISTSNSEHTSYRLEIGPGPYGPSNVTDIRAFATTNRSSSISTRSIQTTAIHGLFEEALEGWDLAASFLMPGLDRYTDLRLITGFYAFDGGQFSGEIKGWKLGVEWRPVPALILSGTWYEDDHLRDTQWFAGIGFEIPLGMSWEDQCHRHTRTLKERMTEPVHRNRQITIASGSKLERLEIQAVSQTHSGGKSSLTIGSGLLVMGFVPTPGSVITAFGKQFLVLSDGNLQLLGPRPDFLLQVPEPSRALLLLISVAGLLLRRRRPHLHGHVRAA